MTIDVINVNRYCPDMIKSFQCKNTAAIFKGLAARGFPLEIQALARRKLQAIDAAAHLSMLRVPPGNRLELLRGDRAGQYSIRINDQWRICFRFEEGNAYGVEIVDYH